MKIQSLSIVVPSKGCINKCPFCVSRMVGSDGSENLMDINHPHYDINVREYLKRMRFVADNGCQTLMLTGTGEPQQNKQFLATFALLHQQIGSPFTNIEMQTTGMTLEDNDNYLRFLRNFVGVNTVALSINSLKIDENYKILGHNECEEPRVLFLHRLCPELKQYDFNIRCCFNLSDCFNDVDIGELFDIAKKTFKADQITFRKLYASDTTTEEGRWVESHKPSEGWVNVLRKYIRMSPILGMTMYGATCYDIDGMSVIYDDDCMGKNPETDVKKYLILRPNCKLYSQWDSKSSLVF